MSQATGSACFGLQRDARAIFHEALRRCSVADALADKLRVGDTEGVGRDRATLRMHDVRRLLVIAMGKGAATMLHAVLQREDLAGNRAIAGVLVAPEKPPFLPASMQYFRGGHPLPDDQSRYAAQAILQAVHSEKESSGTLCLFLISGGASAMVELPLDATIGEEDTAAFHRALVHSGLSIVHINALRKHFSAVKGGRLAVAARHLRSATLLMSDVPADHLDALASGPTLPDSSTVADCRRILRENGLAAQLPKAVQRFFASTDLPETPKPGQLPGERLLLLSEADLAQGAAAAAQARGYVPTVDDTPDDWPAAAAARHLLQRFRALKQQGGRVCLVSTGEVAVALPAASQSSAAGGRNQHFVLECARQFTPGDGALAVLSCGSDGVDGNSRAAGAVIASADFRSGEAQVRVREALAAFDSNTLLRRMGCVVETGPTGLNLRDLRLILG